METKKHIVMFSGGAASWCAAKRAAAEHGTDNLVLLFADTKMEDEDLYRFLEESARDVGGQLVRLEDGRDPWEVFMDVRYLGNSRIDPCSRILKRDLIRTWLNESYGPEECVIYLGMDCYEAHRLEKARPHWEPYTLRAPLCEQPYMTKVMVLNELAAAGIETPRLYRLGFPHNNCGGFCIKAGMAHFKLLHDTLPERYRYHERKEEELRQHLDKDVAIMRDRSGGEVVPLTLKDFRKRIEGRQKGQIDMFEWGGCGCFTP